MRRPLKCPYGDCEKDHFEQAATEDDLERILAERAMPPGHEDHDHVVCIECICEEKTNLSVHYQNGCIWIRCENRKCQRPLNFCFLLASSRASTTPLERGSIH